MLSRLFLMAFALTALGLAASAQEARRDPQAGPLLTVSLKDGTTLVGHIADEDATHLTVLTLERLTIGIARSSIVSMREAAPPAAASSRRIRVVVTKNSGEPIAVGEFVWAPRPRPRVCRRR